MYLLLEVVLQQTRFYRNIILEGKMEGQREGEEQEEDGSKHMRLV